MHGDRHGGDGPSIVAGPAKFADLPVMVVGHQKGREMKEKIARNFGMSQPSGYRKALRVMQMAEKFNLPIITLVDTPGAYPGIGAEERHVAEAIAVNIRDMSALSVPIISIVIGEGGSGGALGIAVADTVMILENSYYSVISPEGCAAILWKDRAAAPKAAEALKFSPENLKELGVVDTIISEPAGGAHRDYDLAAKSLKKEIKSALNKLLKLDTGALLEQRYSKFRNMGVFEEQSVTD